MGSLPRLVRRAVVALIVILAFVALAIAGAHTSIAQARALDWVRGRLERDFGLIVEADRLRYNVLARSVALENARLSVSGDRPFLEAQAIRIVLSRSVLRGDPELERLSLERPRVLIVRHADGRTNLPESEGSAGSPPSPIRLGLLSISALGLEVEDESAGSRVTTGPIDLTLDTRSGVSGAGAFGPSPIAVSIGSEDPQVSARKLTGHIAGRLAFDGSRLTIQEMRLDAPEGRVGLEGWIDVISEAMPVEARSRIEIDLARAGSLVGPAAGPLSGSATADVTIRGPIADPTVHAAVLGRSLRVQSSPDINLSAEGTYARGRVDIGRAEIKSPIGDADANGSIEFRTAGGTPGASRLSARIARADIDALLAASGIESPVRIGSAASGRVEVVLEGASPLSLESWPKLQADGALEFTPGGSGLAIEGRAGLTLHDGRWAIRHDLRSPVGPTTLAGVVSGASEKIDALDLHSLSGRTRLQIHDLQALFPLVEQAGVRVPAPFDQTQGSLDAQIDPRGTLQAPVLDATIAGRTIRVPDFAGEGTLDSIVTINRTGLTARSLDARVGGLSVNGSVEYAWDGLIDSRFTVTADDMNALAVAFDLPDHTLIGSMDVKGSVRGRVESPDGRAEVIAGNLSAYGLAIGAAAARLQLHGDRLDIDATAADLAARLRGGLDIRAPFRFQADADLDRAPVERLIAAAGTAEPIEGTITATLRATGAVQRLSEATGTIDLRAIDVTVAGVPIALVAPAVLSIETDHAITVAPLHVRVGRDTEAHVQGVLAMKEERNGIDVRVNGSLADILPPVARAFPDYALEADGSRFDVNLHVGGSLTAPRPVGTVTLEAADLRYPDIPSVTNLMLEMRIDPARIALESLAARWQGANVSAKGALPLRMIVPQGRPGEPGLAAWGANWLTTLPAEPRAATLSAHVSGITTDALTPFVDPARLQKIAANVDATVDAEADRFSLDALRASLVLDQAALELAGVPFVQSVPTRARLERGQVHLEGLRWNAQGNELRVSGDAALLGPAPAIDLVVDGAFDLRMLGAFAGGLESGGIARPALTVKGPLASPDIVGGISVEAGELRIQTPGVSASDFNGTLAMDASRRATVALKGLINGGPATIEGSVALDDLASPRGRVSLAARNVMLEYPEGFQTESNADVALTLGQSTSSLSGRVDVLSGVYREPVVVSRALLAGLGQSSVPTVGTESSFLSNLRLDVTVATSDDIRIDNNYGRLNLSANLVVTGSAERPGLLGRLEAEPDGEVYLAGNTYRIETLTIDLTNPRTIAPEVTFLAETRVTDVGIEIAMQCSASGPCEREIRSQTAGKTNEEAEAVLFGAKDPDQAGAQLARMLSGELLGIVGRTVGLDALRLEQGAGERSDFFDDPTLVAGDVDPASRLTVGKRLGEHVELAYSQDLSQNGFVMTTSYFGARGISFRALLLDNDNRSYEFRHQPQIGGRKRPARRPAPGAIVDNIRVSGTTGFTEPELRRQLRLTQGDRFEFVKWQEDRERLRRFYQANGFFEARVRARRILSADDESDPASTPASDTVTLEYAIERGDPTRLEVSGFDLPGDVRNRIVDRWTSAILDGFLQRDAALIVREHLYDQGHLQATVNALVQRNTSEAMTVLRIEIEPGPVTPPRLEFEGNTSVPTEKLLETARSVGPLAAWLDPSSLAQVLERMYRDAGFLSTSLEVLAPRVEKGESVVRVVIHEGGLWQIGRVTLGGADRLTESGLLADLALNAGDRYDPAVIAERIARLEQRFRDDGFLDVGVMSETVIDQKEQRADIHVLVEPGPRSILASIAIEGNRPDDPVVVRNLRLDIGQPIGPSAISGARRRLYETGTYRSVEIALDPVSVGAPPETEPSGDREVVARVRVEERPRYTFRYGLAVNSDFETDVRTTRLGFAADLENKNVFGRGLTAGLSVRLRRDQEVARLFLGANRFFGLPLRSNVFLSRSRQDIGSGANTKTVSDVTEVSAEQVYRLRRLVDLRYGYGLGRNRTTSTFADSTFDLTVRVARLTTSGVVDRRSDPFDPARGWFSSANLEVSRPGLGSDLSFLRSFLQHYQFVPMHRGFVLASAARLGLARTFRDEPLIPSERFFAGGATSVRGYDENDLGPRSIFGDAAGGSATLIVNGELRFPVYRWIRGVGFIDLGNVYPMVSDILQSGVQVGTGAGIRVNSPVGLLRFDLGFAANPRPFDPSWTVHFGLGHAF